MSWSLERPTAPGSQLFQPDHRKQTSTLDSGKVARAGGGYDKSALRVGILCSGLSCGGLEGQDEKIK